MNILQITYHPNIISNNLKQQNRNVNFKFSSAQAIRNLSHSEFISRNPSITQLRREAEILLKDYFARKQQAGGILSNYLKYDWIIEQMSSENFILWYSERHLDELKRIEKINIGI